MSSFPQAFLHLAATVSLGLLGIALALTVARIVRGPTLPDRVLGLDMLTAVGVGIICVIAIDTGFTLYVDIAISLGLVGFLATVAFSRFILARGKTSEIAGEMSPIACEEASDDFEAEGFRQR